MWNIHSSGDSWRGHRTKRKLKRTKLTLGSIQWKFQKLIAGYFLTATAKFPLHASGGVKSALPWAPCQRGVLVRRAKDNRNVPKRWMNQLQDLNEKRQHQRLRKRGFLKLRKPWIQGSIRTPLLLKWYSAGTILFTKKAARTIRYRTFSRGCCLNPNMEAYLKWVGP